MEQEKLNYKQLVDLPRQKQLEYTSKLLDILKNTEKNESKWEYVRQLRITYGLDPKTKDSLRRSIILNELVEADCILDPANYTFSANPNIINPETGEAEQAPIGTKKKEFKFDSKIGDYTITSEAILSMENKEYESPEELLKLHGYNPKEFTLLKSRTSFWQQGNKELGTKNLYSSRIEVTPKKKDTQKMSEEDYRRIFKEIVNDNDFTLKIQGVVNSLHNRDILKHCNHSDKVLLIMLSDCHLGRLSTPNETGKYQTLQSNIYALQSNVDKWVEKFSRCNFRKIILPFGNDFLNSSFTGKTTLHGHEQDNSTTIQEIYRESAKAMILIIEKLAKIAPVYVPFVPGNHDKNEELALILTFEAYFRNDSRVTFDTSSTTRKYIKVGKNLICLSHGYNDFKKLGANMILNEASELVSPNCKSYWICGHVHHLNLTKEDGNVEIWQCPAFCDKDTWTEDCGYNAKTRTMAFVFNDNEMIETHYMSV